MASSSGFLIEMRLQAQNTHISEAVKKILRKKPRESSGLGCVRPCGTDFTAERPRCHRRARRARRENLPQCHSRAWRGLFLQKPSFTNVILSAAGRFACKSAGGVEEPLPWPAAPHLFQESL